MQSKLHLDGKLTILIATYNRRALLIKNIQFYKSLCRIIVMEDSESDLTEQEKTKLPDNVEWSVSKDFIEKRFDNAVATVKTDFCALMCDDELLSPEGLALLISFLQDNQSFSCANGMAIGFKKDKRGSDGKGKRHDPSDQLKFSMVYSELKNRIFSQSDQLKFSMVYSELKNRSFIQNEPKTRALMHMSFYSIGSTFAVHRTKNLAVAIRSALIANSVARYSGELAMELTHVLLGKTIILPIVYWIRNYSVPPIRETHPNKLDAGNRPVPFTEWWNNPANKKEKEKNC